VGPTRFQDELALNGEEFPDIDAVIISHDHYDHLNKYSVRKLINRTGLFIVPSGVGARLVKWGVSEQKIVELRWWEEHILDNNLTIAATPAQHFSGRGLFDRNKTLWASWAIFTKKHSLYFSGDSGYFDGFKRIGDTYGPFDMTFIECGAYNKSWPKVHMFPEQTVQAHRDLGGKVLQPIHWATFNLSLHSWYEPMERLVSEAGKEGVKVSLPVIGKTVNSDDLHLSDLWWQPLMAHDISSNETEETVCTTHQCIEEI
jgi:L-ascorbate metabolism protein UlaG (beta-lactamase superfamily)